MSSLHRGIFVLGNALTVLGCQVALDSPDPLAIGVDAAPAPGATGPGAASATDAGTSTSPDAAPAAPLPDAGLDATSAVDGDAAATTGNDAAVVVRPPFVGTTELGKLAAGMSAGTWAKLVVSNQNAILGVGSVSGSMLHYSSAMPWNPLDKVIEILGADHNYPSMRHVRYDAPTNQFVLVADNAGVGTGHGYDHVSLNPKTGDLYYRMYGGFSGTINARRKTRGASSFVAIPSVSGAEQVAIGTCWWSGASTFAGADGAFVIFNSGNALSTANDGQIVAFDPLANTWTYDQSGKAPFLGSGATYHSVIEYSASKNVAVYGGSNVATKKLWRLSSDGTTVPMPDVPAGKGVGVQAGLLTNEPVTGNFLLLSAGELWELDPSGSGTWTKQTGARVPPADVGIPGAPATDGMIVTSIPEYGVVVFIKQSTPTSSAFWVYRHA